jgi:hypothetical protein
MLAARARLSSHALAEIEAAALGLPAPDRSLIERDRAVCQTWDRANGGPFTLSPVTHERIAQQITVVIAELRAGIRPIQDLPQWQGTSE